MPLSRAAASLASYIATATTAVACFWLLCEVGPAFAEGLNLNKEEIASAEKYLYDSIEDSVKQQFQSSLMGLMKEEGVASKKKLDLFISVTKMLLYNKASMHAACAGELVSSKDPTNQTTFEKCFGRMADEMIILQRILRSYGNTRKMVTCGMKARLFERELLLPPYEFLKGADTVLVDAKVLNECLREK